MYQIISNEWQLCKNVLEVLGNYRWQGRYFGIITNQGGIAHGFITEELTKQLLVDMITLIKIELKLIDVIYYWACASIQFCPHRTDANCYCRKPSPFMLLNQVRIFTELMPDLRLDEVLYIGDQVSDQRCAELAQIDFCYSEHFFAEY